MVDISVGNLHFKDYFQSIFQWAEPQFPTDFHNLITNSIAPNINQALLNVLAAAEVQRAVFDMGNYKSPRPDGMTVVFYKTYWGIVKEAMILEVQRFSHQHPWNQPITTPLSPLSPKQPTQPELTNTFPLHYAISYLRSSPKSLRVGLEQSSNISSTHVSQPLSQTGRSMTISLLTMKSCITWTIRGDKRDIWLSSLILPKLTTELNDQFCNRCYNNLGLHNTSFDWSMVVLNNHNSPYCSMVHCLDSLNLNVDYAKVTQSHQHSSQYFPISFREL